MLNSFLLSPSLPFKWVFSPFAISARIHYSSNLCSMEVRGRISCQKNRQLFVHFFVKKIGIGPKKTHLGKNLWLGHEFQGPGFVFFRQNNLELNKRMLLKCVKTTTLKIQCDQMRQNYANLPSFFLVWQKIEVFSCTAKFWATSDNFLCYWPIPIVKTLARFWPNHLVTLSKVSSRAEQL